MQQKSRGGDVAKWGKLLKYLMWDPFDVPNGLKKLQNLRHCFRNDFSSKASINM